MGSFDMRKLLILAGILVTTLTGCTPSVPDRLAAKKWSCGSYGSLIFTKDNRLAFTSTAVSPPKHHESAFDVTTDTEALGRKRLARLVLKNPEVANAMFGGAISHRTLLVDQISPLGLQLNSGEAAVSMTCFAER